MGDLKSQYIIYTYQTFPKQRSKWIWILLGVYLVNSSLKIIQKSYLNKCMNPQVYYFFFESTGLKQIQTFSFHSFIHFYSKFYLDTTKASLSKIFSTISEVRVIVLPLSKAVFRIFQ